MKSTKLALLSGSLGVANQFWAAPRLLGVANGSSEKIIPASEAPGVSQTNLECGRAGAEEEPSTGNWKASGENCRPGNCRGVLKVANPSDGTGAGTPGVLNTFFCIIVDGVPNCSAVCWALRFDDESRVGGGVCICEESMFLSADDREATVGLVVLAAGVHAADARSGEDDNRWDGSTGGRSRCGFVVW